jgi:hypothetical protein
MEDNIVLTLKLNDETYNITLHFTLKKYSSFQRKWRGLYSQILDMMKRCHVLETNSNGSF